jgi:hypothetical protein
MRRQNPTYKSDSFMNLWVLANISRSFQVLMVDNYFLRQFSIDVYICVTNVADHQRSASAFFITAVPYIPLHGLYIFPPGCRLGTRSSFSGSLAGRFFSQAVEVTLHTVFTPPFTPVKMHIPTHILLSCNYFRQKSLGSKGAMFSMHRWKP